MNMRNAISVETRTSKFPTRVVLLLSILYTVVFTQLNSSKSALAEHVCRRTSHKIAWKILESSITNICYGQQLCLEAWHIKASPCALNRDDGSYLPQEYLLVVDK